MTLQFVPGPLRLRVPAVQKEASELVSVHIEAAAWGIRAGETIIVVIEVPSTAATSKLRGLTGSLGPTPALATLRTVAIPGFLPLPLQVRPSSVWFPLATRG